MTRFIFLLIDEMSISSNYIPFLIYFILIYRDYILLIDIFDLFDIKLSCSSILFIQVFDHIQFERFAIYNRLIGLQFYILYPEKLLFFACQMPNIDPLMHDFIGSSFSSILIYLFPSLNQWNCFFMA